MYSENETSKINEEFIKKLYETIIEKGIDDYQSLLDNTSIKDATDKYWICALELYDTLSSEQKTNMIQFAKLVMIDTISSVFGILDGLSSLNGGNMDIKVEINGQDTEKELQDNFLEYIEGKE